MAEKGGFSRRKLLGAAAEGGLNLVFAGGIAGLAKSWTEYLTSMPAYSERRRLFTESPEFTREIEAYMDQYDDPGGKLEESLEYGDQRVIGRLWVIRFRELRTRIQYVRDELMRGEIVKDIPQAVREELSFLAAGKAAVESEFHNDESSDADAHRIFQITRRVYEGFGKTGDEMRYLGEQIEIVQRLFAEHYARLSTELASEFDVIKTNYFSGDTSAFHRAFVAPLLINAYQAGPERMIEAVREFTATPMPDLRGYDVYDAIAQRAQGTVEGYGPQSGTHVAKIYAMAFLINSRR